MRDNDRRQFKWPLKSWQNRARLSTIQYSIAQRKTEERATDLKMISFTLEPNKIIKWASRHREEENNNNKKNQQQHSVTRYNFTRILILNFLYIQSSPMAIDNLYLNIVLIQMRFICACAIALILSVSLGMYCYRIFIVILSWITLICFRSISFLLLCHRIFVIRCCWFQLNLAVIRFSMSVLIVCMCVQREYFLFSFFHLSLVYSFGIAPFNIGCVPFSDSYHRKSCNRIQIWSKHSYHKMLPKRKEETNELKPHIITINT